MIDLLIINNQLFNEYSISLMRLILNPFNVSGSFTLSLIMVSSGFHSNSPEPVSSRSDLSPRSAQRCSAPGVAPQKAAGETPLSPGESVMKLRSPQSFITPPPHPPPPPPISEGLNTSLSLINSAVCVCVCVCWSVLTGKHHSDLCWSLPVCVHLLRC